ncbi:MAG: hypothetical protein CNIPEHKO_01205 [Anaerolineales bacterium]|nr:hypothetical protein [Anaerolineales bacterium]
MSAKPFDKVQQLERIVRLAGAQVRAVEQVWGNWINFTRRRRRFSVKAIQPQGDVIRMGVEILKRVRHPPERPPRRDRVVVLKRRDDQRALLLDVGVGFRKGIIVAMKFIVTEKAGEELVLLDVGGSHHPKRARTDGIAERFNNDFDVVFSEHSSDYKRL